MGSSPKREATVERVRRTLEKLMDSPQGKDWFMADPGSRLVSYAYAIVDTVAAESDGRLHAGLEPDPPPKAPKPQHALVLIGSSANSESAESTLFVRDLQSEAVFKIQGVRV